MEKVSIKIDENNHFRRLDKFIRKNFPKIKLASIYKLIRKGNVKVNGVRVKDENFELKIGDLIEIFIYKGAFREEKRKIRPIQIELDVLYEDEKILVIDKPAGLSVHLGTNVSKPTILEALLFYGQKNNFTPFLVHRLDKYTSGILVVAKDRKVARILSNILKSREIEKYYLTLVKGTLKANGRINEPINGKEALTFYKVVRNYEDVTLLEVRIMTGRKHQIRKHMANLKHPVIGDDLYGDWKFNRNFRNYYGLKRHFLHSYKVVFKNPFNGKILTLESRLPRDLKEVLEKLEKTT